jgi:muconate cycloisomerase
LESSVGASAHLQVLSTFRELAWGLRALRPANPESEHVTEPLRSEDLNVHLPTGPKIGVVLDEDKLRRYARS